MSKVIATFALLSAGRPLALIHLALREGPQDSPSPRPPLPDPSAGPRTDADRHVSTLRGDKPHAAR